MQPGTSLPVGEQHFVIYSPINQRDIWLLYEGPQANQKRVESFLFDSTGYVTNREKRRAAVAAAEEHLRFPGPFNLDSCLARLEFIWQQLAMAQDLTRDAVEMLDYTSFQVAAHTFQTALARHQELYQWMEARGFKCR